VDFEVGEISGESFKESSKLSLISSKAKEIIGWENRLTAIKSIELTAKWWDQVLNFNASPANLCRLEIRRYLEILNQSQVE
jgi:hypothetical protein